MSKKKNSSFLLSFKPKSNSIYLAIIVFDKEQNVLLTPYQQYPILPIFTRDRLAYHNFTINNPDFHSILQWSQQEKIENNESDFLNKFILTHSKLMQLIGCSNQKGLLYRHILEFQRPTFKLLFMLYPFDQLTIISPLSRTSRLYWYPSHNQEHNDFITKYELMASPSSLTTKLWHQPRTVYHSLSSQLPRGLYLALFYCQSSPSNCRRGLQIYLEKHHEHRLPCVPLRYDTSITANEWEWLQTFGRKNHYQQQQQQDNLFFIDDDKNNNNNNGTTFDINLDENQYHISHNINYLETYDFLTKEMQEKQQLEQQKIQKQLLPFQQAMQHGCNELQSLTGIHVQLNDLFTEDSLCLIYDHAIVENKDNDSNPIHDHDYHQHRTISTIINDDDNNDDDDNDDDFLDIPQKTLKKKTLSIADMFSYGQKQIQQSWSKPVHIRMLIIVKPLCLTPDFPVRPNFDFYPYRLFKSLYHDKLQFATTSLESPLPRKKTQHHVSMSDLLNSTIKNSARMFSNRPHSFVQQHPINNKNNDNNDRNSDYDMDHDLMDNSKDSIDSDNNDLSSSSSSNNNSISDINPSLISYQTKYTSQYDKSSNQSNIMHQKRTDMIYKNNEMDFSMAILYHENDLKGWTSRLLEFDRQRMTQKHYHYHQPHLQQKSILHSDTSTVTTNASFPIMPSSNIRLKHRKHHRMNSTCSLPIDFAQSNLTKVNTIYHQQQQQCNYFFDSDTKSLSKWLKQWWISYRKK